MEKISDPDINSSDFLEEYYKPDYSKLFNKIKQITAPVKNKILIALLDGQWHSEMELVRIGKKQQYMGVVTLGTMINSLNHIIKNNYLEKSIINGEMHYKISDNYVGLTRAAYNKYRFAL